MKSGDVPFQLRAVGSELSESASNAARALSMLLLLVLLTIGPLVASAVSHGLSLLGMYATRTTFMDRVGEFEQTLDKKSDQDGWYAFNLSIITPRDKVLYAVRHRNQKFVAEDRRLKVTITSSAQPYGTDVRMDVSTLNALPDQEDQITKFSQAHFDTKLRAAIQDTARQAERAQHYSPPDFSIGGITAIGGWFPYLVLGLAFIIGYLHRKHKDQRISLNHEIDKISDAECSKEELQKIVPLLDSTLLAEHLSQRSWYPLAGRFIFGAAAAFFIAGVILSLQVTLDPDRELPAVVVSLQRLLRVAFEGTLVIIALILVRRSVTA